MTQPLLLDGVTAQQIFDDNVSDLKLSWIGGLEGADRTFPPEAVKAAAASSDLVGQFKTAKTYYKLLLLSFKVEQITELIGRTS